MRQNTEFVGKYIEIAINRYGTYSEKGGRHQYVKEIHGQYKKDPKQTCTDQSYNVREEKYTR